jgi:hypothetical protein
VEMSLFLAEGVSASGFESCTLKLVLAFKYGLAKC